MVNARLKTPQGQSVTKPEIPVEYIQTYWSRGGKIPGSEQLQNKNYLVLGSPNLQFKWSSHESKYVSKTSKHPHDKIRH